MTGCKCDMRTLMLGDGCSICNPEMAKFYAEEAERETMTTPNTEPIPVAQALRLCEMALADEALIPDTGLRDELSRSVMRPLIELVKNAVVHAVYNDEVKQGDWIYPPLAALRDHYDRVRPDWKVSK